MRATAPSGVPALKAAAVYGLDPARGEREGQTHPFSWEEGLLLLFPLTTGLCSSPCPGSSLPAWYFSACLSPPRCVPVCPHVPACTCSPVCVSLLSAMAQVARGCLHIEVHLCFSAQLPACASPCVRLPAPACVSACISLHWPFLSW